MRWRAAAVKLPKYLFSQQKCNFLNFRNYFWPEGVAKNVKLYLKAIKGNAKNHQNIKKGLTYVISDLLPFEALK